MDDETRARRTRETRARRAARRQRAELVKSRRRDPHAWDFGRFWIITAGGEAVGAEPSGRRTRGRAGDPPGLTLDQAEAWLRGEGQ